MAIFALKRLLWALPVLFVVTCIGFITIGLVPGNAAIVISNGGTPAQQAEITRMLGLDRPIPVRYADWAWAALHGDLGRSILSGAPVLHLIANALPVTLSVAALAVVLSIVVGVPIGALAALRPQGALDRLLTVVSSSAYAIPQFLVALFLLDYFGVNLRLFPASGYVSMASGPLAWADHLILPAASLALGPAALLARQARASVTEIMNEDYIRTARAYGLSFWDIMVKRVGKNAVSPVVTVLGLVVSLLIGGSVIVETMFNLPGIGYLAVQSILSHDYTVTQGIIVMAGCCVLAVNLVVDIGYAWLNPRLRV